MKKIVIPFVAHNIDLAPIVQSLRSAVIHWTHRDPRGSHSAGWVEHNGRRYQ